MTSYEEETDYRNIPSELLDSNIPVGRGMIKWAPFVIYILKDIDYFV